MLKTSVTLILFLLMMDTSDTICIQRQNILHFLFACCCFLCSTTQCQSNLKLSEYERSQYTTKGVIKQVSWGTSNQRCTVEIGLEPGLGNNWSNLYGNLGGTKSVSWQKC